MQRTIHKIVQGIARKRGYLIERRYDFERYRLDLLSILVAQANPRSPDFYFMQVGANDGEEHDPIKKLVRQYNWRGLLWNRSQKYSQGSSPTIRIMDD